MSKDILLNENGDIPVYPTLEDGLEITVQRVKTAIALFRGEWLLDDSSGLPWIRWMQTMPPPLEEMETVIFTELDDIEGVESVYDVQVDLIDGIFEISASIRVTNTVLEIEAQTDRTTRHFHPIFSTNIKRRDVQ